MKYVLVLAEDTFSIPMFKDLWKREDVKLHIVNRHISKPMSFLRRIQVDPRCSKLYDFPGRDRWEIDLLDYAENDTCYLFSTEALRFLSDRLLRRIKNHPAHPRMILLLVDSMHVHGGHMRWVRSRIKEFPWDMCLSYDIRDCQEFGFCYMGSNIYSFDENCQPSNNYSDIYFIGRNKSGRNDYVKKIYHYLTGKGVKCNFHLLDTKLNAYKYIGKTLPGLTYHLFNQEKYDKVLADVLSANCILEIVQKGQKSQTARYYEAVCANKKLLTNNMYIKELSFYDERYMKVFDSIDDIDVNWIKQKVDFNYGYNGEFSPLKILDLIKERIIGK